MDEVYYCDCACTGCADHNVSAADRDAWIAHVMELATQMRAASDWHLAYDALRVAVSRLARSEDPRDDSDPNEPVRGRSEEP